MHGFQFQCSVHMTRLPRQNHDADTEEMRWQGKKNELTAKEKKTLEETFHNVLYCAMHFQIDFGLIAIATVSIFTVCTASTYHRHRGSCAN